MRKFSDFIKEEIDLRGNRGIPDDFMRNSEEEAGRNLGVRIDDESQMRNIWPQFQQLMNQSMQLMMQGPDGRGNNKNCIQVQHEGDWNKVYRGLGSYEKGQHLLQDVLP